MFRPFLRMGQHPLMQEVGSVLRNRGAGERDNMANVDSNRAGKRGRRWLVALTAAVSVWAGHATQTAFAQASLTEHQQKVHDEILTALEGIEKSLADIRAKLSSGDGNVSSAYNSAVRTFNMQSRRIGQLPAGHEKTKSLTARAEAVKADLDATAEAVRAGPSQSGSSASNGSSGSDKNPPAASSASGSTKLDYRQEADLKDARYYMNELRPRAEKVVEITSAAMDADAIRLAISHMEFVNGRMKNTVERLNRLPGNHPEVKALSEEFNKIREQMIAAHDRIQAAAPEADRQVAELGQQEATDREIIDSWSAVLGNPQALFDNRPDDAIATAGQLPQMQVELKNMLGRWEPRLAAKPNDPALQAMVRKLQWVDEQLTDLSDYAAARGQELPGQIDQQIAQVQRLIDIAVNEKRPAYFGPTGGITQQLGYAEAMLKMLEATNKPAHPAAVASVEAIRVKSHEAQKSLSEEIIRNNKMPAELYSGPDVEELRQAVIKMWNELHPGDQVLKVVFKTDGWRRTTRWDWSEGYKAFYKVDFDHIQPSLWYKKDDSYAVAVPVEIYKDYMKEGRIVIKPWDREADPSVIWIYKIENVK